MSQHDFDFGFGPGRHLRGRGWFGLLALTVVIAGGIFVTTSAAPKLGYWAYDQARLFFFQGASRSQSQAMIEP